MNLFVIYSHTSDQPDPFVVRRWTIKAGEPPIPDAQLWGAALSLEQARLLIPPGLCRIVRHDEDNPCVVETWM